jgi:translation initiation factor IF-1
MTILTVAVLDTSGNDNFYVQCEKGEYAENRRCNHTIILRELARRGD